MKRLTLWPVFLSVLCLVAEPVAAASLGFVYVPAQAPAMAFQKTFSQEAVTEPLLQFMRVVSGRHQRAGANREAAAMFGRGYSKQEIVEQVVYRHMGTGNWNGESVRMGHYHPDFKLGKDTLRQLIYRNPLRPAFLLNPDYAWLIGLMRLIENYYLKSEELDARDHLDRIEGRLFRFLDKTTPWSQVMEWRKLIFQWESADRFVGGFADMEAAYLPFPLIARLHEIHHRASHLHQPRIKHLALEILAQLLHHEAEHLANGPGWENLQEVDELVKKLDRLFFAVKHYPFGEIYLQTVTGLDSIVPRLYSDAHSMKEKSSLPKAVRLASAA